MSRDVPQPLPHPQESPLPESPAHAHPSTRKGGAGATDWRALTRFDFYRLALSLVLVVGLPFVPGLHILRTEVPYLVTGAVFGLAAALSMLLVHLRWPGFPVQVALRAMVDLSALLLLLAYAGWLGSGLEVLLVVEIAALALLAPGRPALAAAAAAVVAVVGLTFWMGPRNATTYYQAALLGTSLLAVAVLASALGRRVRQSEALAEQRAQDLVNLAQLNDYIIQRIDAGIVVVDAERRIRLMNETAWFLFGNPVRRGHKMPLRALDATLADLLEAWLEDPEHTEVVPITLPGSQRTLQPRFSPLGKDARMGVLIFLEDVSEMRQRAQDLKLSSLGRLTMSIAHEVRNPLGAISHAAQLLEESPHLQSADRRLLKIIRQQSRRMNEIIENVMELSRRGRAQPVALALAPWVSAFVEEFRRAHPQVEVEVHIQPQDTVVWMDPSHLHQVMINLCQNAAQHGAGPRGQAWVGIRGGRTRESAGPFLEVVDRGPGIHPEDVPHLFEPFYTTRAQGTGLGLYIARELCEANHARLEYVPVPTGGSCFRITFRDPQHKGV